MLIEGFSILMHIRMVNHNEYLIFVNYYETTKL